MDAKYFEARERYAELLKLQAELVLDGYSDSDRMVQMTMAKVAAARDEWLKYEQTPAAKK